MKSRRFLSVVPRTVQLWSVAIACSGLVIGLVVGYWAGQPGAPLQSSSLHGLAGVVVGVCVALWLACLGYVYADARDRGMPPILWVLVAMMVPNLLGFLLYFVIRKPLTVACPACGHAIGPDQLFCSWCGSSQARAVPVAEQPLTNL
jgi:hypothetical protein